MSSMTAAELQAYLKQQRETAGTPEAKPKPAYKHPTEITAEKYRAENVDQVEHGLQKRGVKWFRLAYPMILIAAVPNAAKRSFALAQMLKDEGMVEGFPDLIVPFPAGEFHGLYIETKTRKIHSKVSDAQIKIHTYLRAVGYEVLTPRTFEEFQSGVDNYLTKRI